jgi:hypothetical protein
VGSTTIFHRYTNKRTEREKTSEKETLLNADNANTDKSKIRKTLSDPSTIENQMKNAHIGKKNKQKFGNRKLRQNKNMQFIVSLI